jgi:hypothetical protein
MHGLARTTGVDVGKKDGCDTGEDKEAAAVGKHGTGAVVAGAVAVVVALGWYDGAVGVVGAWGSSVSPGRRAGRARIQTRRPVWHWVKKEKARISANSPRSHAREAGKQRTDEVIIIEFQ